MTKINVSTCVTNGLPYSGVLPSQNILVIYNAVTIRRLSGLTYDRSVACVRTRHGPVRPAHVLLSKDVTDQADASVHQPDQETRQSEHLVGGRVGGHVTEDHLEEQTCGTERRSGLNITFSFGSNKPDVSPQSI